MTSTNPKPLARRRTTVTVYDGPDADRIAGLSAAAADAERAEKVARGEARLDRRIGEPGGRRLFEAEADTDGTGDGPAVAAAVERVAAARDELEAAEADAAERAVTLVLEALPRSMARALLVEHPVRPEGTPGSEDDARVGVNTETYPDALLCARDDETGARTVVEPVFDSVRSLRAWLEELSDGQYEQLWQTAAVLNRSVSTAAPKAPDRQPTGSTTSG